MTAGNTMAGSIFLTTVQTEERVRYADGSLGIESSG